MTKLFATWFGTGLIMRKLRGSDAGSGTVASVFAFPLAVVIGRLGIVPQLIAAVAVAGVAYWAISTLVEGEGDAGWIVADEAAGTFVATLGLGWGPALVALVAFRAADIFKGVFPGVARAESQPGAAGVLGDDLVAGVYGLAAGWAAAAWLFPG